MKLLHLTKIATLTSLMALSNIGCASEPVRPSTTTSTPPPSTAEQTSPSPNIQGAATGTTYDPSENRQPTAAAGFKVTEDGRFIPMTKDGKEFTLCSSGRDPKSSCAINTNKVTIKEIKNTIITKMVYSVNPTCVIYCVDFGDGFPSCFTDPQDKNCAKFNK